MKYTPLASLALGMIAFSAIFTGCGPATTQPLSEQSVTPPAAVSAAAPVGSPDETGVVVMARAEYYYTTEQATLTARTAHNLLNWLMPSAYAANPATQLVNVTLAANTTLGMSTASFVSPAMSNSVLEFGSLGITSLQSNALNQCGSKSTAHCGTALFRIYTAGTAGAGFYNATDGYGAPMTAGLHGGSLSAVGLDTAGALNLESISLPANKHVVNLSDFNPAPVFDVKGDFSSAGAGTYSTTITVEFALAP